MRNGSGRRVALLVDREQRIEGDPQLESTRALARMPMEYHIGRVLRALGYEVTVIRCRTGKQLFAALTAAAPDVAFNVTEHMYGDRTADIHVTSLLEIMRIPYTGATAATLLLTRNKAVSKGLAAMAGVRVPPFALAPIGQRAPHGLPPFPVVVKPVARDSSEGISLRSLVHNDRALERQLETVHRRYRQPAIVESFIDGVDVYVFGLQGEQLEVRAPQQLSIDTGGVKARSMATFSVKHNESYRSRWQIHHGPAAVSDATRAELEESVRRLWPVLQMRDYARFDFRLAPSGEAYFIEANANPGFSPASRSDVWTEDDYVAAVRTVVENALRRGGRAR